jgi:hypothetical protein
MKISDMKMTVTLTETDVKLVIQDYVQKAFPDKTIKEVRIKIADGYDDGPMGYSASSLSKIEIDLVPGTVSAPNKNNQEHDKYCRCKICV